MISLTTPGAAARRSHHGIDGRYGAATTSTDRSAAAIVVTYVECGCCSFEPDDPVSLPRGRCPKCNAHSWRRNVRPGCIAAVASRTSNRFAARPDPDDGFIGITFRTDCGPAWQRGQ